MNPKPERRRAVRPTPQTGSVAASLPAGITETPVVRWVAKGYTNSSAAISAHRGMLVYNVPCAVRGYRIADGKLVWTLPLNRSSCHRKREVEPSSLVLRDGRAYLGGWDRWLYAVDITTGDLHWKRQLAGGLSTNVEIHGPTLYGGVNNYDSDSARVGGWVFALDWKSGKRRWRSYMVGPVSLRLVKGTLVGLGAQLRGFNPTTGRIRWTRRASAGTSTVVYKELLLQCIRGKVFSREPRTGSIVQHSDSRCQELRHWNDRLVLETTSNAVIARDPSTLQERWRSKLRGYKRIAFASKLIYVTAGASLFALDARTGRKLWRFRSGHGGINSAPAVADGGVFFATTQNHIYALGRKM